MACQSKNLTAYTQYSNKYLRLAYLDQQLVAYQKNINIKTSRIVKQTVIIYKLWLSFHSTNQTSSLPCLPNKDT